jgi:hypothetical protein
MTQRRLPFALLLASGFFELSDGQHALAQDNSRSWGYTTLGIPGLLEMPSAFSRPDGEFVLFYSQFGNQYRGALTFQVSDRLSGTFRYAGIDGLFVAGVPIENWDRSFSLHYRLLDERQYLPAITVGLNDILGTGYVAGEYVVASKTLTPKLRATVGLGWGRLGSYGGFSNPLSALSDKFDTRVSDVGLGGTLSSGQWFRGDAAFFGGFEWLINDRLRFVAEYSSDAYVNEDGAAFDRKSPINLGLSWQANDRTTLSAHYLYGSEFGFQVNYAINPRQSRGGSGFDPSPVPIVPRDQVAAATWGDIDDAKFRATVATNLAREGIRLEGFEATGNTLSVSIRNEGYARASQATGRTARILTRIAPQNINRFRVVLSENGIPVTSVLLNRSDLETLEFDQEAPDLLRSGTVIADQTQRLGFSKLDYPISEITIKPYIAPSLFDPDVPIRADAGIVFSARYEPLPGLVLSGVVRQRLVGNRADNDRFGNSVLPHVRTDALLYAKASGTSLSELTAALYFRPGANLFGRITVGYLETMFGGVSTEILWKPQSSALALGAEVNYAVQREFDSFFGFQDYDIVTGHVSAYYEFGSDYQAQLDVGRYLAGDVGATLTLAREFDNGFKIGAYATKTDVSAADFGEGSFDKGILISIPLEWATGKPSKTKLNANIKSINRDGGARLSVPGRLYGTVRELQATELDASWGRFWK